MLLPGQVQSGAPGQELLKSPPCEASGVRMASSLPLDLCLFALGHCKNSEPSEWLPSKAGNLKFEYLLCARLCFGCFIGIIGKQIIFIDEIPLKGISRGI